MPEPEDEATPKASPEVEAPSEPQPEVHVEPEPVEPEWAGPDDVPPPWVDRVLPDLGKKVRIRLIGALEGAELAYIPEFATFGDLMAEMILESRGDKDAEDIDQGARLEKRKQLEIEQTRYAVMMAHVAVMDPQADPTPVKCSDCGLEHPPALWTRARTEQLGRRDLRLITSIADREEEIERVAPFSEAGVPPDTVPSADTGESTPA